MAVVLAESRSSCVDTGEPARPRRGSCNTTEDVLSMGGLLASDVLLEFIQSRPDRNAPLWPRIIACIAFDTPVSPFAHLPRPWMNCFVSSILAYTRSCSRTALLAL